VTGVGSPIRPQVRLSWRLSDEKPSRSVMSVWALRALVVRACGTPGKERAKRERFRDEASGRTGRRARALIFFGLSS
jgi:hypothetical protein